MYKRGLLDWRRRIRRPVALLLGPFAAAGILVAALLDDEWDFAGGVLFGVAFALWVWVRDAPPHYVEHWRIGSAGERKTERVLRPLMRAGWRIYHDIADGRGNRDHIVVGPGGLFLIDSKSLGGRVEVDGDIVITHRPGGTVFDHRKDLGRRLRGAAAGLHGELASRSDSPVPRVRAVAALWCEFTEGQVEGRDVTFVAGTRLAGWLQREPTRLQPDQVEQLSALVAQLPPAQ